MFYTWGSWLQCARDLLLFSPSLAISPVKILLIGCGRFVYLFGARLSHLYLWRCWCRSFRFFSGFSWLYFKFLIYLSMFSLRNLYFRVLYLLFSLSFSLSLSSFSCAPLPLFLFFPSFSSFPLSPLPLFLLFPSFSRSPLSTLPPLSPLFLFLLFPLLLLCSSLALPTAIPSFFVSSISSFFLSSFLSFFPFHSSFSSLLRSFLSSSHFHPDFLLCSYLR